MVAARPTRLTAIVVTLVGVSGLLAALSASKAHASCNAIPAVPIAFESVLGSIDRPFARPGSDVKISLGDRCANGSPGFCSGAGCDDAPENDVVVSLVFKPPRGSRNVVVLATDCPGLTAKLQQCAARPDVETATCVPVSGRARPT
jgi:hypothetical protein